VILVNGLAATSIPVEDRGLNYGDGLFETVRVHAGKAPLIDRHLARLRAGSEQLGIPYPGDGALRDDVGRLLGRAADGVLRLVLTRGDGGRGYAPPRDAAARRIVSLHPLPASVNAALAVGLCATRLGSSPALAGLKHLGRLEQVLAAAEVARAGWDEGLMVDQRGQVIEATRHNLFYLRGATVCTPPLQASGVAGVMRGLVLDVQASRGRPVETVPLRYDELHDIDELLLCNAVAGIRPVGRLAGRELPGRSMYAALRDPLAKAGVTWLA
jgi:4-amino-4-deoxychorismate lyase